MCCRLLPSGGKESAAPHGRHPRSPFLQAPPISFRGVRRFNSAGPILALSTELTVVRCTGVVPRLSEKRRKFFDFVSLAHFRFVWFFFSVEMIGCKCFEWLRHFCVIKDYTTTTTSTRFVYSQTRSAAQFWIATHKNALMEADWWRRPCRTISAARSVSLSSTSAMIWITLLLCATHLTVRYHHLLF